MNKPNKRQEKVFNKMHNILQKDLQRFSRKWLKYPLSEKDEVLRRHIFFMQIRDGMHNVLQVDSTCAHLLNDMIKHAKKDALDYQRDLYKEDK